jgi:hypothetical protein
MGREGRIAAGDPGVAVGRQKCFSDVNAWGRENLRIVG